MPRWRDRRPLKHWRYVGAYGPELMLCVGDAHIGPIHQRFWALVTRNGRVRERTALLGSGGVRMSGAEVSVEAPRDGVRVRVRVEQETPVETLSRHGDSYIWTAKQGGVRVSGLIELDGSPIQFDERGLVDHSAGYHARHTVWSWSAGVGVSADGRPVAWNLVTGVHDAPEASERTVWVDGEPREVGPVEFADDLSRVGDLAFTEWGAREDKTNAWLLKSEYRQPFGTFRGTLPDGTELREGYGVMESHDVWW